MPPGLHRSSGKAVGLAFEAMARTIFQAWPEQDVIDLVRLMRRFADAVQEDPSAGA